MFKKYNSYLPNHNNYFLINFIYPQYNYYSFFKFLKVSLLRIEKKILLKNNYLYSKIFINFLEKKNFFFFSYKIYELMFLLFNYFRFNKKMVKYSLFLPTRNQRTRNGLIYNKNNILKINKWLLKYFYYDIYSNLVLIQPNKLLFLEFFNKIFYFFWNQEWVLAYKKRKIFENKHKKFRKWKFCWEWLYLQRPLNFIINKKKKNKKKLIIPKNRFNIGFFWGFSKLFSKSQTNYQKLKKQKINYMLCFRFLTI